ncbi:6-phosphogluconate dehydrogenase [Mycena latifolia]|nr:6-phosphogluconate dehydrogenase [Mycena latifolia]
MYASPGIFHRALTPYHFAVRNRNLSRNKHVSAAYLGCGAGTAACAVPPLRGPVINHDIRIWAAPKHRKVYDEIKSVGFLKSIGEIEAVTHPILVDDLAVAVNASEHIVVTVPPEGTGALIDDLAKLDLTGKSVTFIESYYVSPLARERLKGAFVFETVTLPYACRMVGPTVNILGIKTRLQISGDDAPANIRNEIASLFLPRLEWCRDSLHASLLAVGAIVHTGPGLIMAGLIGNVPPELRFYRDVMGSDAGLKIVAALDQERRAVAKAYGYELEGVLAFFNSHYGTEYPDRQTFTREAVPHNRTPVVPTSLNHRYLYSDVKRGLTFLLDLAFVAGIAVPHIESVVRLAGTFNGDDYTKSGRTLRSLGLDRAKATANDVLRLFGAKHRVYG